MSCNRFNTRWEIETLIQRSVMKIPVLTALLRERVGPEPSGSSESTPASCSRTFCLTKDGAMQCREPLCPEGRKGQAGPWL